VKTGATDWADEIYKVQRLGRRLQQRSVECVGQGKARRKPWSSTASRSISGRLDSVLPLDIDRQGRESEADAAQLSLTIIQVKRKS